MKRSGLCVRKTRGGSRLGTVGASRLTQKQKQLTVSDLESTRRDPERVARILDSGEHVQMRRVWEKNSAGFT